MSSPPPDKVDCQPRCLFSGDSRSPYAGCADEADMLMYAEAIAAALAAMHGEFNMAHLDIKPENVFFSR